MLTQKRRKLNEFCNIHDCNSERYREKDEARSMFSFLNEKCDALLTF